MSTCQSNLPGVQETIEAQESYFTDSQTPPDSRFSRGSRRRPPGARDLRMYERVVIEDAPQHVVAAEEKLTQGYVSKRIRRVIEWMGRVGNKEYGAAPAEEKLRYLQRFAEKKYDYYRRESEAAFHASRQDLVIIKERGTRQAAEEGDEQNVGKFVGDVKIEKTIRPREGKPQFLREARQGVDNLVLLACNVVARKEMPLPIEPDQQKERQKWEQIERELARARILDAKVACREQEIGFLRHDLAVAQKELAAATQYGAGDERAEQGVSEETGQSLGELRTQAEPGHEELKKPAGGPPAATRRLILVSHNSACVPLKESELLELEKDGLAWLAEVAEIIATLEPINEYDTEFHYKLKTLWRNSDRNYRQHGIIPERQKLPRLEVVRRGRPYTMGIPMDRNDYSPA